MNTPKGDRLMAKKKPVAVATAPQTLAEAIVAQAVLIASRSPDSAAAVAELMEALADDQDSERELIRAGAESFVMRARHRLSGAHKVCQPQGPARIYVGEERAMVTLSLLDTFYVGAKRLGDCTRDDLMAASDREGQMAEGHRKRAGFLRAVADKCGAGVVREAVKEAELAALHEREIGG